jgi:16S rRNA (guanine966-N2)-methyltransferase
VVGWEDLAMTRIVAGAARGRRLSVPQHGTRPTSDRAREALFSSLESVLGAFAGVRVLDLYAGTGAVGLEAASRGAAEVTLVESDRSVARVLHANVAAVGLPAVTVHVADVRAFVAAPADADAFDVVFLDPPYATDAEDLRAVLGSLADNGWLAQEATVVVERSSRGSEFDWPQGFEPQRSRRYGEAMLWYALWYRRGAPGATPGTDG